MLCVNLSTKLILNIKKKNKKKEMSEINRIEKQPRIFTSLHFDK